MKVMVSKVMCRELNKYAQTQPVFNQYEFQFDLYIFPLKKKLI